MKRAKRQGFFVDPPATLLRKPSAAPTITPEECIAVALTAAQWKPGNIIDPDREVVQLCLRSLKREGWRIAPIEAKDRAMAEFRRDRYGHNYPRSGAVSLSRITYVSHAKGYVTCRRPGCMPFVITEKQWSEFPIFGDH